MSGGSYDYAYHRVREMADLLRHNVASRRRDALTDPTNIWNQESHQALRERFAGLLDLVATAMHDIEWTDSGDCGPGDEVAAIEACFAFLGLPRHGEGE